MTEAEKMFIKKAGDKWPRALVAAWTVVRSDNRFLDQEKLRTELATKAAFEALGGVYRSHYLAELAVGSEGAFTRSLDALVDLAASAARGALGVVAPVYPKAHRVSA